MEKAKVIRESLLTGAESKQSGKHHKAADDMASIKSKKSGKRQKADDDDFGRTRKRKTRRRPLSMTACGDAVAPIPVHLSVKQTFVGC